MDGGTWTKLDIFTTTAGAEALGASLLELGINGFQVQDAHDFEDFLEHKGAYWDYYDEELLKLKDSETIVTVYLSDNEQGADNLKAIRGELERLKAMDTAKEWGRLECEFSDVREEDWALSWKKYYHPAKVGERLVVCPSWEEYEPCGNEAVIKLDPGMAFGTGTHESTRLCMRLMEKHVDKDTKVLDLGTGSGILAISAVLLGARSALGIDIDETSVKVAAENAMLNDASQKCRFLKDSVGSYVNGGYGLVFANIVADVIIEYARHIASNLSDSGVAVLSGIIDDREQDVLNALEKTGLDVLERETDGGWVCLVCKQSKSVEVHMENQAVIDILKDCESLLDGHFLLSSGKHSNRYCQCAKLLQHPEKAERVLSFVTEQVHGLGASVVVGPAMGGVVVAYELARQLGIRGVFTERVDGDMQFRRGFTIEKGEKVLISEDVVTTGKSTLETVKAIEALGGKVIGICCIADRRTADIDLPFPVFSATAMNVETFEASACPLCAKGIPAEKPGSRKEG